MARKTATMPTLFKRSNHGCYCFRRVVGSKRITINTNTTDYTAAKQFLRKYLQGESATALAVTQKQHVSFIIANILDLFYCFIEYFLHQPVYFFQ